MPETLIGLFPDVGGGYFLSRLAGSSGEWLALTGHTVDGGEAIALGLADVGLAHQTLPEAWLALADLDWSRADALAPWLASFSIALPSATTGPKDLIDAHFSRATVPEIVLALERDGRAWASHTAATLRQRSPLMLHVVLTQVRRARGLSLADDLRMERDLVRHCFHTAHLGRSGASSETVEGIRALAVDKDHQPRWQPPRIEDVTPDMVAPFFDSPWPPSAHPLRALA